MTEYNCVCAFLVEVIEYFVAVSMELSKTSSDLQKELSAQMTVLLVWCYLPHYSITHL